MTENGRSDDEQVPDGMADVVGDALGGTQSGGQRAGMSRGTHGNVTGDDDVAFDLTDCEIVAQAFDDETGVGTRLYHVDGDVYALSQFRRAVSQDWTETLQTHGTLTVDPVKLDRDPLDEAVAERGATPLSDADLAHVRSVYADTTVEIIWEHIETDRIEGLVPRGQLGCVEDHGWRSMLRPKLAEQLTDDQTAAVLDGLMDARPDVDWMWCQLYAVYVAALRFGPDDAPENDGAA
jgi:hypothetical protein